MQLSILLHELERFSSDFKLHVPVMAFDCQGPIGWDKPFNKCFREVMPFKDCNKKSGVYFITDLNNKVLYIGKATQENFGAEIWGKFSAPRIVDSVNDIPLFEKSSMAKYAPEEYRELLITGNVKISAVIIDPANMSSLVEVYLQTYYVRTSIDKKSLPPLNNRIG
jgi:hypothetical protein